MNLVELQRALRQLRLSGLAAGPETRLLQAQTEQQAPIDFLSTLVSDELLRRQDRLLDRRVKQAGFRDVGKTLDAFDFEFGSERHDLGDPPKTPLALSGANALQPRLSARPYSWVCAVHVWRV